MTNENSSPGVASRCQFQFADRRHCRMLRSPDHSSLCLFHARQELQLIESQRLSSEIGASQDRVLLRKANALAFLGQVMLSSLSHVKKEFPFSYKFDHWNKVLENAAPLSTPPDLTNSRSSPECLLELPGQTPSEGANL
ncbi:MAG: hypothetical protein WBE12_06030 [Candidatus Acidiferrum sp.]